MSRTALRHALCLLVLLAGCDDGPAPESAVPDAGPADTGPEDAALPDADLRSDFGLPAPPADEVLGDRLSDVRQLVPDGEGVLALTGTGSLYRVTEAGAELLRRDLPEDARLVPTPDGPWVASAAAGVLSLAGARHAPAATGLRGAVFAHGAVWWLDDEEGGRLRHLPYPEGPAVTWAANLGAASMVYPMAPDQALVGVGGDEPRTLLRVTAAGGVQLETSRFIPTEAAALAGTPHLLMLTGAGWLERLGPAALERLAYAGRGSGDLQAVDGALWWRASNGIHRYAPGEGVITVVPGVQPAALLVHAGRVWWADPWKQEVRARPLAP
ncbi:MAG: hypothetical protein H6702_16310 [Myxococcales bacterium]|nr:hypothetical protein [Myxococcales bacterium]